MNKSVSIPINKLMLSLLFAVMLLTPLYEYYKMSVILVLFIIWFTTAITIDKYYLNEALPSIAFLFIVIILDYFRGVILNDTTIMLLGINKMPLLIWPMLLQFYYKRIQLLKGPLVFAIIAITVSAVFTLRGNILYAGASRLLAGTVEYYANTRKFYRSLNIGGYGLIYGIAFLIMPLMLMLKQKTKSKLLLLFIIILYAITIIYASYLLAIIITVFLIAFSLVNVKKKKRIFAFFITVLLLILVFSSIIEAFFVNIGYDINSEILVKRVTQLFSGEYIRGYGSSDNRLTIYMNAIKNWLDRPLLGSLQGGSIEYRRSGHSAFLGYLEQYGLIACLYYWYYFRFYKTTKAYLRNPILSNHWFTFYMCFCFFALVDTIDTFGELGAIIFFVCPAIFLYLDSNKDVQISVQNSNYTLNG